MILYFKYCLCSGCRSVFEPLFLWRNKFPSLKKKILCSLSLACFGFLLFGFFLLRLFSFCGKTCFPTPVDELQ